jgi:hypothetical protein
MSYPLSLILWKKKKIHLCIKKRGEKVYVGLDFCYLINICREREGEVLITATLITSRVVGEKGERRVSF